MYLSKKGEVTVFLVLAVVVAALSVTVSNFDKISGNTITGAVTGLPNESISDLAVCGGATACDCEDTVTSDYTMTSDLACEGISPGGLNVGANGITIDCDGFKIKGDGSGGEVGIKNTQYDNVIIQNCNIYDFSTGIAFDSSNKGDILGGRIINNNISSSATGILLESNHTLINLTKVNASSSVGIQLDNALNITISYSNLTNPAGTDLDVGTSGSDNHIFNNEILKSVNFEGGSLEIFVYNNIFPQGTRSTLIVLGSIQWNTTLVNNTNYLGGNATGGNFYSNYVGIDTNDDGIGDTLNYTIQDISPTVIDQHPMVIPYSFTKPYSDTYTAALSINSTFESVNPMQNGTLHSTTQYVNFYNTTSKYLTVWGNFQSGRVDMTTLAIDVNNSAIAVDLRGGIGNLTNHTLYLNNSNLQNGIIVCPEALTITDVSRSCTNSLEFSFNDVSNSKFKGGVRVTLEGDLYKIENVSGSGSILNPNSSLRIYDQTDAGFPQGGLTIYDPNSTFFFANYTDSGNRSIVDANCTIFFHDNTRDLMQYNSTASLYVANKTYLVNGTRSWNVTCQRDFLSALTTNDSVQIDYGTPRCGKRVMLDTDLTRDLSGRNTCLTAGADNLVLNGVNFSLIRNGTGSGYGINVSNFKNITIKGFNSIRNFTEGIHLEFSGNSTIFNNTINNQNVSRADGMNISFSNQINVSNNTIYTYGLQSDGIRIISSTNASIYYNVVNTSGQWDDAISLSYSNNSKVYQNRFFTYGLNAAGIYLFKGSSNNSIDKNFVKTYGNQSDGIYLENSPDNNFSSNDIKIFSKGDGAMGAYVFSASHKNYFENNSILTKGNNGYGIYLSGGTNNTRWYKNRINTTGSNAQGIVIIGASSRNSFIYNAINVSGSSAAALQLNTTSTNNSFHNDSFFSLNSYGILDGSGDNVNNTLNYTTFWGFISWEHVLNITAEDDIALNVSFHFGNNTVGFNSSHAKILNLTKATVGIYGLNESYNVIRKVNNFTHSLNFTYVQNNGADCITTGVCVQLGYDAASAMYRFTSANFSTFSAQFDAGVSCGGFSTSQTLTGDLSTTAATCFVFNANNLFLDCDGYRLTGIGSNTAIYSEDYSNFTVRNCRIRNFSMGVRALDSFNNTVVNVNVSNGTTGVSFLRIQNSSISNSTYLNLSGFSLSIVTSHGNAISNILSTKSLDDGIYLNGAVRNNITNAKFWALDDSSNDGVINLYPYSNFNRFEHFVVNASFYGTGKTIQMNQVKNNTFINGTLYGTVIGIDVLTSNGSVFKNITTNASPTGVRLTNSWKNQFTSIYSNGTTDDALYITTFSINNTFSDITVMAADDSANDGVIAATSSSSQNRFENFWINITSKAGYGIRSTTSFGNVFKNGIVNSSSRGLLLSSSDQSYIENVTFLMNLSYGVVILGTSGNNTLVNLEIPKTLNGSILDLTESGTLNNLTFNNTFGEITWNLKNISTGMNFSIDTTIFLQNNTVGIANQSPKYLNSTATIELKSLSYADTPHLRRKGLICDYYGDCNISSYSNGVLLAQVSYFNNYSTSNNTQPNVTAFFINLPIYTNTSNVTANVTVVDAEGDNISLNVSWYVNDVLRKTGQHNISASESIGVNLSLNDLDYNKNDVLNLTIIAYDDLRANDNTSNKTTVYNFHPVLKPITLNGTSFKTTDDINASSLIVDADLDSLTVYVKWYVNGVQAGATQTYSGLSNGTNLSDSFLTPSDYSKNQIVNVTFNVTDSTNSTLFWSSSINISNSVPNESNVVSSISITQGASTTVSLSSVFTDADSDDINFTILNSSIASFSINNSNKQMIIYADSTGTISRALNVSDKESQTWSTNFTVTVVAASTGSPSGGGGSSSGGGGGGSSKSKKFEITTTPVIVVEKSASCGPNQQKVDGKCICKSGFTGNSTLGCTCPEGYVLFNKVCEKLPSDKTSLSEIEAVYTEEKVPPTFFHLLYNPFSFLGCMHASPDPVKVISRDVEKKALQFFYSNKQFDYAYEVEGNYLQLYMMLNNVKGNYCTELVIDTEGKGTSTVAEMFTFENLNGDAYFFSQRFWMEPALCGALPENFALEKAVLKFKEWECNKENLSGFEKFINWLFG